MIRSNVWAGQWNAWGRKREYDVACEPTCSGRRKRRGSGRIGRLLAGAQDPNAFRKWLLGLYADGDISARKCCIGAWSTGSSAPHLDVADIAMAPESSTGIVQKHLERKLGLDTITPRCVMWVKIPQHNYKRKIVR